MIFVAVRSRYAIFESVQFPALIYTVNRRRITIDSIVTIYPVADRVWQIPKSLKRTGKVNKDKKKRADQPILYRNFSTFRTCQ